MQKNAKILVDYISFTVSLSDFLGGDLEGYDYRYLGQRIEKKFLLGTELKFEERKGFYGYNMARLSGGITYCFGGRDDLFVQMSGKGCRLWETLNPGAHWLEYLELLRQQYPSWNVSRLDIACDTFGDLDIGTMQTATTKQKYVSRFRDYLVSAGNRERSIMFGAPSSRFRLRIYDKTLERLRELGTEAEAEVPKDWVRLEFQMRDDTADSFLREWFKCRDVSVVYFGIMRGHLRYWSKYNGKDSDRMVLTRWWDRFLGNYGKIALCYEGGVEYNLDHLRRYVFGQAGSSIRTFLEASGGDVSELLEGVADRPLNPRQQELLRQLDELEVVQVPLEL